MFLQKLVDSINAIAAVYAFDILPDGSFSEIRLLRINKLYAAILPFVNPNAPEFVPDTPYSLYFRDVNFESFCYKCASKNELLYSCANAHGSWIQGMYLPLDSGKPDTVYCCYVCKHTDEPETDSIGNRSSTVSSSVLNISADLHRTMDFTQAMTNTAKNLKEICSSEFCAVFPVDKNEEKCTLINENGEDIQYLNKLSESMRRTPYETAVAWENDLAGSDCLILDDLSIIKERDEKWYNSLCEFGIKSIVFYSVRFQQKLVGFIWAANFDTENMMRIKETLELTTFFIGAVIANHQLLERLESMSVSDRLTGVKNRNAMDCFINAFSSGACALPETMGIVYADLNGLKTVNDNEGHEAGDKMLKDAVALLKHAFADNDIYRMGGDEFVILCPNITEDILESQTAKLRILMDKTENISFAIGTGVFGGEYDIEHSMKVADERMYEDKKEYYRLHPEKNRRNS